MTVRCFEGAQGVLCHREGLLTCSDLLAPEQHARQCMAWWVPQLRTPSQMMLGFLWWLGSQLVLCKALQC